MIKAKLIMRKEDDQSNGRDSYSSKKYAFSFCQPRAGQVQVSTAGTDGSQDGIPQKGLNKSAMMLVQVQLSQEDLNEDKELVDLLVRQGSGPF